MQRSIHGGKYPKRGVRPRKGGRRIERRNGGDFSDARRKHAREEIARGRIKGAYARVLRRQGPWIVVSSIVRVFARERKRRCRVRFAESSRQVDVEQVIAAQQQASAQIA